MGVFGVYHTSQLFRCRPRGSFRRARYLNFPVHKSMKVGYGHEVIQLLEFGIKPWRYLTENHWYLTTIENGNNVAFADVIARENK